MYKTASVASVIFASLVFAFPARATEVGFSFSGAGFNGNGTFTYVPDVSPTDPDPNCGTDGDSCRADPAGAFKITGITGTFSDAVDGISNAAITGLVPIDPVNETDVPFDPLVPSSLSRVGGLTGLTYDNLFFPDGNPIDCEYPFDGTYLDVFGVAFTVNGGDTAVLWGDGVIPGVGPTYGVGVYDGSEILPSYAFQGVDANVPEPITISLFGAGLAGAIAMRRRKKAAVKA